MNDDIKILQEKIARVEKDLSESMAEDNSEKKRTVLSDYLEYLKDELRMLQNGV
jgi:hypothetical protein